MAVALHPGGKPRTVSDSPDPESRMTRPPVPQPLHLSSLANGFAVAVVAATLIAAVPSQAAAQETTSPHE